MNAIESFKKMVSGLVIESINKNNFKLIIKKSYIKITNYYKHDYGK